MPAKVKWTREEIIRQILQRDAVGLPLNTGGKSRVPTALYVAAARVFGSWRNAVTAAGIRADRAFVADSWSLARIFMMIRNLSRRRRPIGIAELDLRYRGMVNAARRLFGSWTKAVVAAGADPAKFQRVVPWTKERVIEAILMRALKNEPLCTRLVQPRSLVEAGQRCFGSWPAAIAAAGLDSLPNTTSARVTRQAGLPCNPRQTSTKESVVAAILDRLGQKKLMSAKSVYDEDRPLYRAASNRFGHWAAALRAAGLDPVHHRYQQPRKVMQGGEAEHPPSHAAEPVSLKETL